MASMGSIIIDMEFEETAQIPQGNPVDAPAYFFIQEQLLFSHSNEV